MDSSASIYLRLVQSRVRSQLQYRASFVLQLIGNGLVSFIDFVAILIFFRHVVRLGGWTLPEIAFLYATSYIAMRLADASVGQIELLPRYIRAGSFDSFLIRPLGSMLQVITAEFSLRHLGGAFQGIALFGYAVSRLEVSWTPARIGMTALMLVTGYVICSGIWILTNSISFWLINTREIASAFTYGGTYASQYPLHIFAGWIKRFFTVLIPIAFINYYPSLFILGRTDPAGSPKALQFLAPLVAILTIAAARLVWGFGIRRYRSTGS